MMRQDTDSTKREDPIIRLARQGNRDAFHQLYLRSCEQVYRTVFRYSASPQDAEDIMQETFIKAFRGISQFKSNDSAGFSAWINRIGIHCAIEHLRRNKRRRTPLTTSLAVLPFEPQTDNPPPEKAAQISMTMSRLKKALDVLSPRQRVIFDLRHSQQQEIKEIAINLRCSESTVKTQLSRAKAKLRKQLEPLWEES